VLDLRLELELGLEELALGGGGREGGRVGGWASDFDELGSNGNL